MELCTSGKLNALLLTSSKVIQAGTERVSDTVIRVENLGKKYVIGRQKQEKYSTLRDAIADRARTLTRKAQTPPFSKSISNSAQEDFWALKDVSFQIKQGDRVGIIGRNGAGKSTLLKLLSRITEPTIGRIGIKGRVASLLEVGTGFHPELTGRENIYLNGAILGMGKTEIKQKFDEIVAFAEVEKFLDTPVKRYSSGMYVRLAFAVAAHLEPEILVVDEVLAVGDVAFQKKCLGKMEDVATKEARTVLFVSHNMGAVQRLCSRGILLTKGQVAFQGSPSEAVEAYLRDMSESVTRRAFFKDDPTKSVSILQAAIVSPGKEDTGRLDVSDPIEIQIHYCVKQDIVGSNLSLAVSRDGVMLFRSWDIDSNPKLFELREAGNYDVRVALPRGLLAPGRYSVYLGAGCPGVGVILQHNDCLFFELESLKDDSSHLSYSRGGMLVMPLKWQSLEVLKQKIL